MGDDRGREGLEPAGTPPGVPGATAVLAPPATGSELLTAPPARPWWALPVVVLAVVVVVAAGVWGIRGLFADPVKGTDPEGVTTLQGSWEPYTCGSPCIGYVQAGGRSVTVILPSGCPEPAREASITVRGRLDTTQGSATYRAVACPAAS